MQISREILEKYLAGTASVEEKKLVNDWYYSFNDEEVEIPAALATLRNEIKNRIYDRLHQGIRRSQPSIKRMTINRRWVVAAAGLGIVLIAAFLYLIPKTTDHIAAVIKTPAKKTITPGENKAVLTLADGTEIVLDSAQNGTIGLQGETTVVKLDNGELAYKAGASASENVITYNTVTTPRGGQYQIVLSDGTHVWLNSASSLKFPTIFTNGTRQVFLTGEGFFEVAPTRKREGGSSPFMVIVDPLSVGRSMKVTVLGTKFNIMAYGDEDAIKTTLLEGSVAASRDEEKVIIRPGQQAGIKNSSTKFDIGAADIKEALAWKNGEFRFNEMNIRNIMRQLARWYDVDVEYKGNLDAVELSGVIPKKENITELLDAFETTGKVHFKVEGKKIMAMSGTKADGGNINIP